jgi:hypothetical protein
MPAGVVGLGVRLGAGLELGREGGELDLEGGVLGRDTERETTRATILIGFGPAEANSRCWA